MDDGLQVRKKETLEDADDDRGEGDEAVVGWVRSISFALVEGNAVGACPVRGKNGVLQREAKEVTKSSK
jgi:hypothetical protein